MSMIDVFKNHKPVENPEYGAKKKLIGDAVGQVQSITKITSKKGKDWIVFKSEAIHVIADPKGRETTVKPGDELTKVYDAADAEAVTELSDDLFTAGISVPEVNTDEELIAAMNEAAKGHLVYYRTWAKEKNEEQLAKNPTPSFFQNIAIKSKGLITPDNSTPMLPF